MQGNLWTSCVCAAFGCYRVNIQVGSENTGDTWTNEKIFDDLGSEQGVWILDDEE